MQDLSSASRRNTMDVESESNQKGKGLKQDMESLASTNVSRPETPQLLLAEQRKPEEKTMLEKCCPCFTVEFFAQYFDVTTEDIRDRLLFSLVPFNGRFHTAFKAKPDLYGPLWIYTTLIIMLAISGNLSRYF